ncbi:MAG: hypothetical protein A3D31_10505 [Candidatus Fluviicola riflensis]|nr:MAG: hypothetical protein A3D31_10505 [Candidatus Fluviicola riflensis]OGS84010.1 MAG: hypothetical protein A3E30_11905 [Fluviicola sp. RIFCSPHIGHO2_12_FULL_43_24]OGS84497.1 MAG: hypothetical protein A2724_07445 [Fluviicola sp. RIFCSPHIGHO2_01_FULL_43_53]
MLKQVVLTGDDNDKLTKTLLDMEQKFVFATTAAIAIPVAQEAALLTKLSGGAVYKTAAKLGLKWLFGGLGGVCVTATSILVYQQQPQEPQQQKPVITHIQQYPDTSNFFVASKTDSAGLTPTISTPKVTEQPYELLPFSPVIPIVSTPLERQEKVVEGNLHSKRSLTNLVFWAPEYIYMMQAMPERGSMACLDGLMFLSPEMPELIEEYGGLPEPDQLWDFSEAPVFSWYDSSDAEDSIFAPQYFDGVKTLNINVDFGNIYISQGTGNQVIIDEPGGLITTDQEKSTLSVFMKPTGEKGKKRCNEIPSFDLNILVPAGTSLNVATSSGSVYIENLEGKSCEVTNNFGDITLKNCAAEVKATASSGSVTLTDITGKTDVHSYFGDVNLIHINGVTDTHISSGSFTASDVKGDLSIQSDFGDVSVSNVRGNTIINSSSGSVVLDSITGKDLTLNSNFGDLTLKDINAASSIVSNSGNVEIDRLAGNLVLNTQFGEVNIDDLTGNLQLYGNSGDIHLKDLIGDLVVDSQFGNVSLKDTKGNVVVQANSGDINGRHVEVTNSLTVAVDFGNSDIELANSADDLRFDVEASMGRASINKGNIKLEEDDGHIITEKGTISIKGTSQSGDISFE